MKTPRQQKPRQQKPVLNVNRKEVIIAESVKQLRERRVAERPIESPTWDVEIGEHVVVGALPDPFVVDKLDEGRIIVIEYTRRKERSEEPLDQSWMAHWWFNVFPLPSYKGARYARRSACSNYHQTLLDSFIERVCEEEYRDNPDYQRDYVWTLDDKINFIDSAFHNRQLGRFIFVNYQWPDQREVLDGRQRLNALKEFVQGKFLYQGRYWHQFSIADRAIFTSQVVQYAELDGSRLQRSELLEIFLETNVAGVPQSEQHLSRVRELYRQACQAEGHSEPTVSV